MDIGHRLRVIRDEKNLSQNDVGKRTGLQRCYISRVENGRLVPTVDTLTKMSHALNVPLYEVMYDGDEPPTSLKDSATHTNDWGTVGKDAIFLNRLCRLLAVMREDDRELLLSLVKNVTKKQKRASPKN